MPRAEQITDPVAHHGEGPVWSESWGGLRWVDMLAGGVLHLDASSGVVDRWTVGAVAAAIRPRVTGGAVIATEREFVVADDIGGPVRGLGEVFADPAIRFNDGACDPSGRFLCGTMAYAETAGAGTLYRLNVDGTVESLFGGVTISNGLAWTSDLALAFYVDTPTRQVDVFDSDGSGLLANRRRFVAVDGGTGSPDGLTVDAAGGVWVALYGGSSVHHYTRDGVLAEVIDVPVVNVTACTFGGPGLDELYITTSAQGTAPTSSSPAGAVYRYAPGVVGVPVTLFGG